MKRLVFCLSLIALYVLRAYSQVDTISLPQAIELARKNNPSMKIAETGIKQSESRFHEVTTTRYPALFFRSHLLYTPEDSYNTAITNGGEYGVQLSTTLPLYDGGVRGALVDQSSNAIARSQINLQKSNLDIAFAVRTQYYETLRAEEELAIRRETVNRLEDYRTLLNQLRLGGGATQGDLLKTQVDLNNAIIAADAARQAVQKAKLLLVNILGGPLNQAIEVAPEAGADSSAIPTLTVEENPEYQLLDRDRKSADYSITVAKGERLPTLTLGGDLGALGIHPHEFGDDLGYSVFLSLDLPIFSWGAISDRIEQRVFDRDQLDAQILLQRRGLETEWRNTLGDLELARKSLVSYRANIAEAEKNYLSAKSRFAGGSGSNLEVLDSQRLLEEVKLNFSSTLFQLRSSLAGLLKLSGK